MKQHLRRPGPITGHAVPRLSHGFTAEKKRRTSRRPRGVRGGIGEGGRERRKGEKKERDRGRERERGRGRKRESVRTCVMCEGEGEEAGGGGGAAKRKRERENRHQRRQHRERRHHHKSVEVVRGARRPQSNNGSARSGGRTTCARQPSSPY